MRERCVRTVVLLSVVAGFATSAPAIEITPGQEGFVVVGPSIPLPATNAADVVAVGASVFVGQGGFGAGQQSILRVDVDGATTTVVSNLNALGGLAYDVAGDRLLFTDNGGDLMGATSGDTIYALPNPRAVVAPIDAATLTLLPSGSIPFAQAVLVLDAHTILVGDAAGPGSGRVVRIVDGVPSDFITGLDYVSGLSTARDYVSGPSGLQQIHVGNVDGTFTPSLTRYSTAGAPLGPINATPISGALDQATDVGGNIFLTGGFTDDFASSTLTWVAQAGAVTEIARGFGFSSGVAVDAPSQRVLVLDFGQTHIDTVLPIPYLTPGKFFGKRECHVEQWGSPYDIQKTGVPRSSWTCVDGDPRCDRDLVANGTCELMLGPCLHLDDSARTRDCVPTDVAAVVVTSKKLPAAASALQSTVDALVPATSAVCGDASLVAVPADRKTRTITFDAKAADGKRLDKDVLKLRCLP